jgi:hypothetical protein
MDEIRSCDCCPKGHLRALPFVGLGGQVAKVLHTAGATPNGQDCIFDADLPGGRAPLVCRLAAAISGVAKTRQQQWHVVVGFGVADAKAEWHLIQKQRFG